jgi:pimeloyl-ACP methyl ester carboxylesterase
VRLVEIAGAYHHLVLDAPGPFTRALDEFLGSVTF